MDPTPIIDALRRDLPEVSVEAGRATDQPTIYVPRAPLVEICRVLRDRHRFQLLVDITGVDWQPREPRFEVTYHLVRLDGELGPARLRVKTRVPGAEARVPTVAGVWPAAGWLEREVWDLFGIVFDDHPDLRRLLMPEDWEGHPLRKDYPVQVMTRPRSEEPLQVTPEEFVRNIERARKQS